jgi:hypothetical protein
MHRTESSRKQEETQTTVQLWTLNIEPASCHFSGAKNLEWLLDFCKFVAPCSMLSSATFRHASYLQRPSIFSSVCLYQSLQLLATIDRCCLKYSSIYAFTNRLYLVRFSRRTWKWQSHVPGPLVRESICNLTPTFLCKTCNFTKIYSLPWIKANFKFQKPFSPL